MEIELIVGDDETIAIAENYNGYHFWVVSLADGKYLWVVLVDDTADEIFFDGKSNSVSRGTTRAKLAIDRLIAWKLIKSFLADCLTKGLIDHHEYSNFEGSIEY